MSLVPERRNDRIVSVDDTPARLKELGLTVEIIHKSISVGNSKRQAVSQRAYPATYRGVAMWAESLAELRRLLLRLRTGWDIGETDNFATIYSEELGIAIAVAAGDGAVGRHTSYDPRLARKKGKKTTERVERNAGQLYVQGELFDLPGGENEELAPDEACHTWFLLTHPTKNEIRLELSCPWSMDADGIVNGFRERILLPPVAASGAVAVIDPDDGDDDSGLENLVTR